MLTLDTKMRCTAVYSRGHSLDAGDCVSTVRDILRSWKDWGRPVDIDKGRDHLTISSAPDRDGFVDHCEMWTAV